MWTIPASRGNFGARRAPSHSEDATAFTKLNILVDKNNSEIKI